MSVSNTAPEYFPDPNHPTRKLSGIGQISAGFVKVWICVIGSVLFCMATATYLLYESNQNTKFLHGMARAFPERLGADWTAGTVDGLPVFSGLVFLVARFGHPILFYVVEIGLLTCLFWSCFSLALRLAGQAGQSASFQLLLTGALVLLAHASAPVLFGYGVADQYLIGGYLQPSEFGVLFLASFALALAEFRNFALVAAAVPAAIHGGYAMLSLIVAGSMMLSDGASRLNLSTKLVAIALIIVPQVDLALRFAPTDYATFREAAGIIAFERIPQHSDPARWLRGEAYAKLGLVIVGIWLAPRGLLRNTLAALLVWAVAGTLVVISTGAAGLALVAPWRASIILVPVSTLVILARLGELSFGSSPFRRGMAVAGAVVILLALFVAGKEAVAKFKSYRDQGVPEYVEFLQRNHRPGDVYLTDPFNQKFRLDALSAQFVSWKTHPYLDREVLEWRRRVLLAREVFGDQGGKAPLNCAALGRLVRLYPVTHVLLENRDIPAGETCPPLEMVFSAGQAKIFRLDRTSL